MPNKFNKSVNFKFALSSLLCSSFLLFSPNSHADLKDGLVAHWSFDDCRATDNSGNGHDGTLNGNPQCVDGVKGKAFSFDGKSDYINIFDQYFGVVTLSAWIFVADENQDSSIIDGWKNDENFTLGINSNFEPTASFHKKVDLANVYPEIYIQADTPLKTSNYNHLVSTFDGSKLTLYVNGIKTSESIVSQNSYLAATKFAPDNLIGLNRNNVFFKGIIDETRIYNRALTEAEVLELYNGAIQPKETVQISGQIKLGTQAGKGVSLSGDGLAESCLTDANGKFNCKITKGWTGFLTPESKGVSFSPPKISVTDAQTNLEVKTPLVGTTTDSFPLNGVMTSDWMKLKTDKATWQVETSTGASDDKTAYEGRFSFGSAKIGANQTAAIETTINVTQAGQLSFARRVSSNPEHGVLNFEISGKQKNGTWKTLITEKSSGDVTWEMKNYALTVGQFKLRWTYAKDGAEAKGEDKAWIDAVSYPSSVKVAAKTCEGITAGTVKLMTIKNPTCDQLQAYMVWLKSIRPSRFIQAQAFNDDVNSIEERNELWQKRISWAFFAFDAGKSVYKIDPLDMTGTALGKSVDFLCDGAFDDPIKQSLCGLGKDFLLTAAKETLSQLVKPEALTGWAVAPYAIEKAISSGLNLFNAMSANDKAEEINSFNLADDFLDEYYKSGSNSVALKAMAKKYSAINTGLSTVVDALANAKGYSNSDWSEDYNNQSVVKSIESVIALNKSTLNYQKILLKKPLQTTQPLLP